MKRRIFYVFCLGLIICNSASAEGFDPGMNAPVAFEFSPSPRFSTTSPNHPETSGSYSLNAVIDGPRNVSERAHLEYSCDEGTEPDPNGRCFVKDQRHNVINSVYQPFHFDWKSDPNGGYIAELVIDTKNTGMSTSSPHRPAHRRNGENLFFGIYEDEDKYGINSDDHNFLNGTNRNIEDNNLTYKFKIQRNQLEYEAPGVNWNLESYWGGRVLASLSWKIPDGDDEDTDDDQILIEINLMSSGYSKWSTDRMCQTPINGHGGHFAGYMVLGADSLDIEISETGDWIEYEIPWSAIISSLTELSDAHPCKLPDTSTVALDNSMGIGVAQEVRGNVMQRVSVKDVSILSARSSEACSVIMPQTFGRFGARSYWVNQIGQYCEISEIWTRNTPPNDHCESIASPSFSYTGGGMCSQENKEYLVTIATWNGPNYWSAHPGAPFGNGGGAVTANKMEASSWEKFILIDINGGILRNGDKIHIKTNDRPENEHPGAYSGAYITALNGGGSGTLAKRKDDANPLPGIFIASEWDTFTILKHGGGPIYNGDQVSFRTQSGKYFVAEGGGGGALNADRDDRNIWETFVLNIQSP